MENWSFSERPFVVCERISATRWKVVASSGRIGSVSFCSLTYESMCVLRVLPKAESIPYNRVHWPLTGDESHIAHHQDPSG
jgi:hypothetical protein